MVYPNNFEHKVAFDTIRTLIGQFCHGDLGKELVDQITFLTDRNAIEKELNITDEFKTILLKEDGFHFNVYFDLRKELNRASIEGTFIDVKTLFDLKATLESYHEIEKYIRHSTDLSLPELNEFIEPVQWNSLIPARIDKILDDHGEIRDNASSRLKEIRQDIAAKEKSVLRKINQALKVAKQSGWTVEDASVTIRDGRQVIPVSASHKRQLTGLVHDESATGQTVYIEPADVLEVNNAIRELQSAEQREIIKILKDLTNEIRPDIPDLILIIQTLGRIDFIRSKARFAILINGNKPQLSLQRGLEWYDAIHPLLLINHRQAGKQVIPLNIRLSETDRILVISGPNAGGKSICLKTVGLLQYMLQCGLHIPVNDGSFSGIFSGIFIDIGDEQSLENDLSTYSSHLLNMKNLLELSNQDSLFLIDEFGSGTEPQLGGAIAESVLEKLNERKAFGVVTTHYSNLKLLAKKGNGIVNGAMLFDTERMEPLYQLALGKPGSSFAFEIARKIGFPDKILRSAEQKTGKKHLDFDQQLQQLDIDKEKLRKQQEEFTVADHFLSEMIDKYEKLSQDLKEKKVEIIAEAKKEALELIRNSNKIIEHTIKDIREAGAEKEVTKMLREKVAAAQSKLEKEVNHIKQNPEKINTTGVKLTTDKKPKTVSEKIKTGDYVKAAGQNVIGEVIQISGGEVIVAFNSVRFKTQLKNVEKVEYKDLPKQSSKAGRSSNSGISDNMNDKLANFTLQLDVRGKRGDEALAMVQHYIDDASLLSMRELKILHGKGNGILRQLIQDHLKQMPEVKQVKDEHVERGGSGITLVILK